MARLFSAPSHTMTLAYTCSFFLLAPFLLGSLSCLLLVAVLGVTLMAPLAFAALCALSLVRIARQLPQNVRAHMRTNGRLAVACVRMASLSFAQQPPHHPSSGLPCTGRYPNAALLQRLQGGMGVSQPFRFIQPADRAPTCGCVSGACAHSAGASR